MPRDAATLILFKNEVAPVTREGLIQLQHWFELHAETGANRKVPVFLYPDWHEE